MNKTWEHFWSHHEDCLGQGMDQSWSEGQTSSFLSWAVFPFLKIQWQLPMTLSSQHTISFLFPSLPFFFLLPFFLPLSLSLSFFLFWLLPSVASAVITVVLLLRQFGESEEGYNWRVHYQDHLVPWLLWQGEIFILTQKLPHSHFPSHPLFALSSFEPRWACQQN